MAADVEENDFLVGDHNGQGNPVAVGDAHRLDSLKFTGQMVIFQVGLERVDLQIAQSGGKLGAQFAMLVNELFSCAGKAGSPDKGIHDQSASPNSLIRSAALPRFTRPAFTSSSEAFTLAT